ncbi:hypothetical protein HMI56_003377 [Coelomomyces lativittatus]|nr:hypothetical protein HMI56_003377 [Coelomomyces lativittatus]
MQKFNSFRHHDSNSQNIVPELIGSYQYWTIPTPSGSAFCRLPVSSPWHPVEPFLNPEDFPNFEIKKLAISPSHSYFSFILEKIGDEHGKLYHPLMILALLQTIVFFHATMDFWTLA